MKIDLVFICYYILVIHNLVNSNFIATRFWQPILEGQSIPPGLHVRINLQTGVKEAKLLDEDDSKKNNDLSVPFTFNSEPAKIDQSNLEQLLKNIPSNTFEYNEDEIKKIKSKFKTYDEIKSDLKKLDMSVKTDSEIIDGLIKKYDHLLKIGKINSTEVLNILEDLEYLVHQIDNSFKFLSSAGLEKIIIPNLINQTNEALRIKSLNILGSLMQNNPKGQIFVFERNIGEHLTKLLSSIKLSNELSMGLFAYGSLLRKFPFAQKEILTKSGLSVLLKILTETSDVKIKIKIITLLSDIVKESKNAENDALDNTNSYKLNHYKEVNLEKLLNDTDFCQVIQDIIIKDKNIILGEFELIEKTIISLLNTKNVCFHKWSECPMIRHFLLIIKHRFVGYSEADEDMTIIYEDLMIYVNALFNGLSFNEMELEIKDELYI